MITAEQIMAGKLPKTTREFNIPGLGKILLHRLPANKEVEAQKLYASSNPNYRKLEKITQNNTYYMLHGRFDEEEAAKLPSLMDVEQLGMIHTTGLFFTDLNQVNLEAIEKK